MEWTFHLNPLDGKARPLVSVRSDLADMLSRSETVRQDADRVPRLKTVNEFDDLRLTGRSIEIADQMRLPCHQHQPGIDTVRHRLPVALDALRADAEPVIAAVRRIEWSQTHCLPRGRTEHDDAVLVIRLAKHALARRSDLMRLFETVPLLDEFRLRPIGDRHLQRLVSRFEILLHQER